MSRFDYKEFNKIWKELNNPNNRVAYISADKASSYPVAELKIFDGNTDNVIFTMEHHEKPYGFIKVNDRDGREIEKSYKREGNLGFDACNVLLKRGFEVARKQKFEQRGMPIHQNEILEDFDKIWKELNNPNNRVAYIPADKASSYPVAELKIFDGNTDNVIFTMEHHEKPYGFIKVNDRDGREIEKSYKHEKNLGFEACSVLFKYGFDIVVEQRKEQGDVLKKTETRAGLSQENSEALYAHYEELMKENLDEVVQAVAQGNPQKVFDLQQEGLHDTRFKDSEVLYTVALCEKVQKEYDSYDTESNVEAQRYPIPGSLKLLGEKVSRLSDEEKSLIPKSVWNRLGNVVINETLNDYYESPDRDGLIDRNTRRLNDGVKNLLPDVAKYGSYEDSRLLNATLIIARANDDESQLGEGQASERALKAAKGCRKRVKRDRAEAQKKQDIQKRIKYLKNKEKEVSGVVIADKIAEAQISGVIYEPVTPERGNKMAENIRRKLSQKSR